MAKKKFSQAGFGVVEILIVFVLIGMTGFVSWYVYHSKQTYGKNSSPGNSSESQPIAQVQALKGTKVVSLDQTYEKYTNYDKGFSLTYSKMVANTAECQGTAPDITPKMVSVPVKVYEDTTNNKVFVAASKHAVTASHQIAPGEYQGTDSCVVKDSTLSDIQNPVSSLSDNNWILSVEFDYATVANTSGLDSFVAAHAPRGIVIDHTTAPIKSGNVSTYKFTETENIPAHASWYFLKYNAASKVAVFWSTPNKQSPTWAGVSSGAYFELNAPTADLLD